MGSRYGPGGAGFCRLEVQNVSGAYLSRERAFLKSEADSVTPPLSTDWIDMLTVCG